MLLGCIHISWIPSRSGIRMALPELASITLKMAPDFSVFMRICITIVKHLDYLL
jgi:hypothetical protein